MHKSPECESADQLLAQVCRLHHARAHTLFDAIGIYRGQPPLLEALWDHDGLTHADLAEEMRVTPATISRMIQRMECANLLVCKSDPDDLRISRVYLTQTGRDLRPAVQRVLQTMEAETLASFTQEERLLLRRFLLQIRENLARVVVEDPVHP